MLSKKKRTKKLIKHTSETFVQHADNMELDYFQQGSYLHDGGTIPEDRKLQIYTRAREIALTLPFPWSVTFSKNIDLALRETAAQYNDSEINKQTAVRLVGEEFAQLAIELYPTIKHNTTYDGTDNKVEFKSGGTIDKQKYRGHHTIKNADGTFHTVHVMFADEYLRPSDDFFTVQATLRRKDPETGQTILSFKKAKTYPIQSFDSFMEDLKQRGGAKVNEKGAIIEDRLQAILQAEPSDYVSVYHATAEKHPVMETGIKATTGKNKANSYSQAGFVYVSIYPEAALGYAKNHYPDEPVVVYEISVPKNKLLPDAGAIKAFKAFNPDAKNTLADSLKYYGLAKIINSIPAYSVRKFEGNNS